MVFTLFGGKSLLENTSKVLAIFFCFFVYAPLNIMDCKYLGVNNNCLFVVSIVYE